jgi:hypothetical protein
MVMRLVFLTRCDVSAIVGEMADTPLDAEEPDSAKLPHDSALLIAGRDVDTQDALAGRDLRYPLPIDCLWPVRRPRVLVRVWLREDNGTFECISIKVSPVTPGIAVSATLIRQLPVGTLVAEAIHRLLANHLAEAEGEVEGRHAVPPPVGEDQSDFTEVRNQYWQRRAEKYRDALAGASGTGRGMRYPEGHLDQVASIVREAKLRRDPITAAVSRVFGISKSAAGNQIARARASGLLDPAEGDPQ